MFICRKLHPMGKITLSNGHFNFFLGDLAQNLENESLLDSLIVAGYPGSRVTKLLSKYFGENEFAKRYHCWTHNVGTSKCEVDGTETNFRRFRLGFNSLHVPFSSISSIHSFQNITVSRLNRKMNVLTNVVVLRHWMNYIIGHILGMGCRKSYS